MRTRAIILSISLSLITLCSPGANADVRDVWRTGEGESSGYLHVRFEDCDKALCGTIVRAFDEAGTENAAYEHLGKPIVQGMQIKRENHWHSGTIWAPDTNKTYLSRMTLKGDTLSVEGCALGGLFCRTMDWSRTR